MTTPDHALPASAQAGASNRPLNREDYKTLGLSALGGTLEFYDFVVFVFFANVIGTLFFYPKTNKGDCYGEKPYSYS